MTFFFDSRRDLLIFLKASDNALFSKIKVAIWLSGFPRSHYIHSLIHTIQNGDAPLGNSNLISDGMCFGFLNCTELI